jgi:hypothetical protein
MKRTQIWEKAQLVEHEAQIHDAEFGEKKWAQSANSKRSA